MKMTQAQYDAYKARVKEFVEREGITCISQAGDSSPYFSWNACDCCGSELGGDRYEMAGYHKETDSILYYAMCPDCLCYMEYGRLDDMTMLDNDLQ